MSHRDFQRPIAKVGRDSQGQPKALHAVVDQACFVNAARRRSFSRLAGIGVMSGGVRFPRTLGWSQCR